MEANEKKTGGTLKKNPSVLTSGILKVLKYLFLIVIIVISIGPIVWAFLSSFKTYAEINASALRVQNTNAQRGVTFQEVWHLYHQSLD